jgi:hypothetical protein
VKGRAAPSKAQVGKDDKIPSLCFIKACRSPTGAAEDGDRDDASHERSPPSLQVKSLPTEGSEASQGHIPRICRSREQGHFIKRPAPRQRGRKSGGRASAAAMEQPAARQPDENM